jgi:23S rRNA (guanosine2251-2'-O)-methyltransferase
MKKYKTKTNNKATVLVLDNIRSVLNVGAIFRTADAFGISKIYLCGVTPTPIDRFGRKRNDLHKTALGAEDTVPWKYLKNTLYLILKLKEDNYKIISLEQSSKSKDHKEISLGEKTCIVLGSETDGINSEILKLSDEIAEIKMLGKKESLNVAVSAGIFLARILDI